MTAPRTRRWYRGTSIALALLLLVGVAAPGAAAKPTDEPASSPTPVVTERAATNTSAQPTIRETQTMTLTPKAGSVLITFRYEIPDSVTELEIQGLTSSDVTAISTDGFARDGERYVWDGETTPPTITAVVSVPDGSSRLPFGQSSVDTGSWAVVERHSTGISGRFRGTEPTIERETAVAGSGVAGDRLAYLGAYETESQVVDGQRIRLVLPAATSDVRSDRALQRLTSARKRFDGETASDTVYAIPLPASVDTAAGGHAAGNAFWIAENGRNAGTTTWVHEYIHTQQQFAPFDSTIWFTEGTADYYGNLYGYYDGRISFDQFRGEVATTDDAEVVLADVSAPRQGAYTKGERVAAALDLRIRAATDDERTLRAVIQRLNAQGGQVTNADIEQAAEAVSGEQLDGWFDRYVTGVATPEVPEDRDAYAPVTTVDTDGDGIRNVREVELGTDPAAADTDGDGLDDGPEVEGRTDPVVADTDRDGLVDGREVDIGTNPIATDTDGDRLGDGTELDRGTDPTVADTDGDGLIDGREVEIGSDPLVTDTDDDGVSDPREVNLGTDPTVADTDGDSYPDDRELTVGTDPTTPTSTLGFWITRALNVL
ncbi:hypothetical protein BRD04_09380 [Halobacteriales archaeon QS_9_67_17]|nr:MAG: hypothetical protein BRD04_09380 [Halobacteriales archaeon QS_9_67_17]